jgi:hypothetical protein
MRSSSSSRLKRNFKAVCRQQQHGALKLTCKHTERRSAMANEQMMLRGNSRLPVREPFIERCEHISLIANLNNILRMRNFFFRLPVIYIPIRVPSCTLLPLNLFLISLNPAAWCALRSKAGSKTQKSSPFITLLSLDAQHTLGAHH